MARVAIKIDKNISLLRVNDACAAGWVMVGGAVSLGVSLGDAHRYLCVRRWQREAARLLRVRVANAQGSQD
jgi:hypothetical protein